jgi:hypothetical protein
MLKSGAENVGKAFSQIKNSVVSAQRVAQQTISSTAQRVAEKILEEVTREELQVFGSLWEVSENVELCRVCRVVFETVLSGEKHHCRSCGSVVCFNCSTVIREEQLTPFIQQVLLPPALCGDATVSTSKRNNSSTSSSSYDSVTNAFNKVTQGPSYSWRLCHPCLRGQGPSNTMKEALRNQLNKNNAIFNGQTAQSKKKIGQLVDQVGTKLVAKVNEVVGVKDEWQVAQGGENLPLFAGSFYPDDPQLLANTRILPAYSALHASTMIGYAPPAALRPIPAQGYIEIANKSTQNETYAVKVLYLPANPLLGDYGGGAGGGGGDASTMTIDALNRFLIGWQSNVLFESARPAFSLLKPQQSVFSFVNAAPQSVPTVVAVVLLHDYDSDLPPGTSTLSISLHFAYLLI